MPTPRFRDADGAYEVVLFCPKCKWAIMRDRITKGWTTCRNPLRNPDGSRKKDSNGNPILCGHKLEVRRIDYGVISPEEKRYGATQRRY